MICKERNKFYKTKNISYSRLWRLILCGDFYIIDTYIYHIFQIFYISLIHIQWELSMKLCLQLRGYLFEHIIFPWHINTIFQKTKENDDWPRTLIYFQIPIFKKPKATETFKRIYIDLWWLVRQTRLKKKKNVYLAQTVFKKKNREFF